MATGIEVKIGPISGITYSRESVIDPTSMRLAWSLGARSTCDFVIKDSAFQNLRALHQPGQRVRVIQNDVVIFDGSIDRLRVEYPTDHSLATGRMAVLTFSCVSHERVLDKLIADIPQFDGLGVISGAFISGFSGTTITLAERPSGFDVGNSVYYEGSSGTIPSGVLWIVGTSGNDVQLALTPGGAPIAVSGGTGYHKLYLSAGSVVKTFCLVDGIVAGTIQPGALVRHIPLQKMRLSVLMQELAELSGYQWWVGLDFLSPGVDHAKSLFFAPPGYLHAPFDITEGATDFRVLMPMSRMSTLESVANKVWAKTEHDIYGDAFFLNLAGDGSRRIWYVLPAIEKARQITVKGEQLPLGIFGQETGFRWYYTPKDHYVIQDPGEPVLAPGEVAAFMFRRFGVGWVSASDAGEIAARAAIEGNSGQYVRVEETDFVSQAPGIDYATALVNMWKRAPDEVEFSVRDNLLFPGYDQTITAPTWGVSGDYMINYVSAELEDLASNDDGIDRRFRYRVRAVSVNSRRDEYIGTWRKFLEGGGGNAAVSGSTVRDGFYWITWGLGIGSFITAENDYCPRFPIPRAGVPVMMRVTNKGEWPVGSATVIDIQRLRGGGSTSVFGTPKLEVPADGVGAVNNVVKFSGFAGGMSFQEDDVLRIDVLSVGSTQPGRNLSVQMLVRAV